MYLVEVVLGVHRWVGSFGEELSDETAPVLVGASLPRGVRVAEEAVDSGHDLEVDMVSKFSALVPGQRLRDLDWEVLYFVANDRDTDLLAIFKSKPIRAVPCCI